MTRMLPLAIAATLAVCVSCGSTAVDRDSSVVAEARSTPLAAATDDPGAVELASLRDRLLIRAAEVGVVVEDVDAALDAAQSIAATHGGVVSDSRLTDGETGQREATFTVRVPSASFEAAVWWLGGVARRRIRSRSGFPQAPPMAPTGG